MILSPEKVEGALYLVTFLGGGWAAYLHSEKSHLEKNIEKMETSQAAQWKRIDEINVNYISKSHHDETKKDINDTIEKSINRMSDSLTASIDKLSERLDRFIEREIHGS